MDKNELYIDILEKRLEDARKTLEKARLEVAKQEDIIMSIENLLKLERGNIILKPRSIKKRITDDVFKILYKLGRPLSLKEILNELTMVGRKSTRGSLGTLLACDKRFKRVKRGVFGLIDGQTVEKQIEKE